MGSGKQMYKSAENWQYMGWIARNGRFLLGCL